NFSFADRVYHTPTSADSGRTLSGGGSYSLSPAEWLSLPIPLWKRRGGGFEHLFFLPQSVSIAFNQTTQRQFSYKRDLFNLEGDYALQNDIYTKSAKYLLGATWRPLPFGTYQISSTRD